MKFLTFFHLNPAISRSYTIAPMVQEFHAAAYNSVQQDHRLMLLYPLASNENHLLALQTNREKTKKKLHY